MILILTGHYDHSTDQVIDWLNYYKARHTRINDADVFLKEKLNFAISNEDVSIKINENINLSEIQSAWYRKFGLLMESSVYKLSNQELNGKLTDFFNWEFESFMSFFDIGFSKKIEWLCNPNSMKGLTKVKQLIIARSVGLDIPNTVVTNDRQLAKEFLVHHNNMCLTKPIGESSVIQHKSKQYQITPKLIHRSFFKFSLVKRFFPSLLQEYLDKDIELRIFFLDGKCFSMAIFSQLDEKTKIDFRHYNKQKPNRFVPFNLPRHIEIMIVRFMELINLNTGSIDMVKTKDNRYVFLEVNPKGQFGMVSMPCNYYLEEKVALSLINKTEKHA